MQWRRFILQYNRHKIVRCSRSMVLDVFKYTCDIQIYQALLDCKMCYMDTVKSLETETLKAKVDFILINYPSQKLYVNKGFSN